MKIDHRIKGAITGHIIGDSFYKGGMLHYSHRSALMICSMASINEYEEIEFQDFMQKFHDFYVGDYMAPGGTYSPIETSTAQSLKNFTNGLPPDLCGIETDSSEPLQRILPIALYYLSSPTQVLVDKAHAICKITHNSIKAEVCCALYCLLIRSLILQQGERVFKALEEHYTESNDPHLSELKSIKLWKETHEVKGDTEVVDSFWSSWQSYSKNQTSFSDCFKVASKTEDPKGTSCLSCALSGATVGLNDIPEKFIRELRLPDDANIEIQSFVHICLQRIF